MIFLFLGWLSDYNLRNSMVLSPVGSALAVLFIWDLSPTLISYTIFAFTYGVLGPGYQWIVQDVFEYDPSGVYVVSILLTGRGVGNVLCAPISTALDHSWALANRTSMAYGLEGFGPSIIFTGTTLTRQISGCYVLRALLRQVELDFIFYTGL
ncbi:hypothetical protein F5051DRAFT_407892, partial [Lentinula edodes]